MTCSSFPSRFSDSLAKIVSWILRSDQLVLPSKASQLPRNQHRKREPESSLVWRDSSAIIPRKWFARAWPSEVPYHSSLAGGFGGRVPSEDILRTGRGEI